MTKYASEWCRLLTFQLHQLPLLAGFFTNVNFLRPCFFSGVPFCQKLARYKQDYEMLASIFTLFATVFMPIASCVWVYSSSTSSPAYLQSLLSNGVSESTATLRSASGPLLHVPQTRTVYGSRAFSVAAPTLWNSLLADLTNTTSLTAFTNCLKIFLFHHPSSSCSANLSSRQAPLSLSILWRYKN